jgi:Tol biopolymer transport system component
MENELSVDQLSDQVRKKHLQFSHLIIAIVAFFIIGAVITAFVLISQRRPRIAFMSDRDENNEIYIMEKDGTGVENISNNEAQDGLPDWSAKRRSMVFLSTRESTSASIYRMNVYGSGLEALVTDMPIIATIPKWSPDGKWVAFDSGLSGTSDVYLINVKSGELKNLTDHPSSDRFYDWSPDSKKILLVSTREDALTGNPCLYTLGIDENSELIRLTEPDSANVWASWSPDGDKIAFTSDRDGNAEIYVMDSNGDNLTRLTENQKFDGFPIWSPDGSRIAYISLDELDETQNPEIYVMNSDGSDQKNISNNPAQDGYNWEFYWSPDGSQILFTTDRDGNLEIYLMDADGGNQTNLTNNPANDNYPTWIQ